MKSNISLIKENVNASASSNQSQATYSESVFEGVTAELTMLTPQLAKRLLKSIKDRPDIEKKQRRVTESNSNLISHVIKNGYFRFNGESIIVSDKGYIMDGQHRLLAVIKTGIAIPVLIVYGIDEDAMDTIDQNKKRTPSDIFNINGYDTTISSVAPSVARYDIHILGGSAVAFSAGGRSNAVSSHELVSHYEANEGLKNGVDWAIRNACQGAPYTKPIIAYMHYATCHLNGASTEFLSGLLTGAGLANDDPRLYIRTRIMKELTGTKKTPIHFKAAWLIRAALADMENEVVSKGSLFKSDPITQCDRLRELLD